jgi:glycerophosphoryl diester phosphodiesterase
VRRYVELAGDDAPEVALLRDAFTSEEIDRFLDDAVAFGAGAISAHQDTVDEAFIDRAHGLGLKVHCWFQDLDTQARLAPLPLDGIVTDWPVDARARTRLEHDG